MLVVKKFGGSSVADKEKIFNVAGRCIEEWQKGNDVVVVLSAMGKTTDKLIAQAKDINPNLPKREMDMLYTIGEQQSVALMAMAMNALGVPAISLNAFQVPIHTTARNGDARITKVNTERIRHELDSRKIVVITGFQGVNKYDDYTTLGRGGSDTTAVAIAAALHADACEIYTDVEGVFTSDPRVVPNAKKLDEITYDEMLELASLGAKVLHNRSVELAKKHNIVLVVRSSLSEAEGTIVKERIGKDMLISGVAVDEHVARISVVGLPDIPGVAFSLCQTLSVENINIDMIIQSVGRDGKKDISFTLADGDLALALKLIDGAKDRLQFERVESEERVAKVSIVGAGMKSAAGVATDMFECLYNEGININMITTSEIRISVLIDIQYAKKAVNAIHNAFSLGE